MPNEPLSGVTAALFLGDLLKPVCTRFMNPECLDLGIYCWKGKVIRVYTSRGPQPSSPNALAYTNEDQDVAPTEFQDFRPPSPDHPLSAPTSNLHQRVVYSFFAPIWFVFPWI